MATRLRDTTPTGKEKRGTSPIHSQRSTTNTSKTTSPVRKQADPTSSLDKNVPSYLKPTIAQAKKSASSRDLHNTHTTNKTSNLARRRSFDNKPPLPSSSPLTRISPNPKERIPRSSSLSAKTSTSQKPLLDKFSKTTTSKEAIGKQRGAGLNSGLVTKKKTTTTTTTTKKHDISNSTNGSTTKTIKDSSDIAQNVISQGEQSEPEDHQELTIHETEKEVSISDHEMVVDSDAGENESDTATEDHIEEVINENVNSAELEDIKAAAESSTLEENPEIKIEEPEEISNEPNSPEKEKDETIVNASEENQESKEVDEGVNQGKETPVVEKVDEGISQGKETPVVEETGEVQEEQQLSLSPKQVEAGIEEESIKAEPVKNMIKASEKSQHQVVQSKNKESVVSNNVIEETASKLREQRKNKVKALAGAFETVISLQEHK